MTRSLRVLSKLWHKIFKKKILTEKKITPIETGKKKIFVQVGLDFGTSNTKIVYSLFGVPRPKKISILFNHGLDTYPDYCLPSVVAFNNKEELLVGIEAAKYLYNKSWNEGMQCLKVMVAGKYDEKFRSAYTEERFNRYIEKYAPSKDTISPEQITSIYLAYAMKMAREIIQKELDIHQIDMLFNVCVPIDHIQSNQVKDEFYKIIAWAELIEKKWSEKGDSFSPLEYSLKIKDNAEYGASGENTFSRADPYAPVIAVPESVAEIASYVLSLQSQSGFHALIDFGAGTTDVSIFNFIKDDNMIYWYSTGNIPQGTIKIEEILAEYLGNTDTVFYSQQIINLLERICKNNIDFDIERRIRESLCKLYNTSKGVWCEGYAKNRGTSNWEDVPIFISGGGSQIPYIKDIFCIPWWPQIKKNYPVDVLPTADDYDSMKGIAPFQRMAVAYGLSTPIQSLVDFVLPKDCPDQTSPIQIRPIYDIDDGGGIIPNPDWLK